LHVKLSERFIHGANDVQPRAFGLSCDLEHPHQAISSRYRDNDKARMVRQARRDWSALRQAAQEIGVHRKVSSG
jgi:hypothetical protein